MTPDDLDTEIKLIFARACAAEMGNALKMILQTDDKEERRLYSEAAGTFYASAYCHMLQVFRTYPSETSALVSPHATPSSSACEVGPQAPPVSQDQYAAHHHRADPGLEP